jgi:hypothetical protein
MPNVHPVVVKELRPYIKQLLFVMPFGYPSSLLKIFEIDLIEKPLIDF